MPANKVAENVLGTIGTILWTLQLVPQVVKSYREKSTEGLSPWLVFLWATSALFLGIYNIVQNINIPLIIQPQLFGALAAVSWTQCLYYSSKRSLTFCLTVLFTYLAIFAGFEAGVSFAVKAAIRRGDSKSVPFFGIFSAIIISIGLFPQYWEIIQRKEVIGISLVFMAVDILGAVFSILSLVFKAKFDVVAAITYILVVVLDGVIVTAALILNPRAARRRRREQELSGRADVQMNGGLSEVSPVSRGSAASIRLPALESFGSRQVDTDVTSSSR